jgi:hypothetical protein
MKKYTFTFSPEESFTYKTTSDGLSKVSLQWIKVSSISNIIVFLSVHLINFYKNIK